MYLTLPVVDVLLTDEVKQETEMLKAEIEECQALCKKVLQKANEKARK